MKIIPLFFALLLCRLYVAGQGLVDTPSTRLLQQIKQSNTDTSRVKFLLALSKQLILKSGANKLQVDSAYDLEKQAEQLSIKAKDLKDQGRSILMAAMIENKKGDRNKGLLLTQQALSYFRRINDLRDEAEATIIVGQHYGPTHEITKQIYYYKIAIELFRQANEKERLATTLVDLADFQQMDQNPIESLKNLWEALKIYKETGFKGLTNIYDLIGKNLLEQGDKQDALKYELLAERSAIALKDTTLQLSTVYYRVSECYYGLLNYNNAILYSEKALVVANKYRDSSYLMAIYFNMARLYYSKHEPQKSIFFADKLDGFRNRKIPAVAIIYNTMYVRDYTDLKKYSLAKTYLDRLPPYTGLDPHLQTTIIATYLYYFLDTKQYNACYPYLQANKQVTNSSEFMDEAAINELYWFQADSALGKYKNALRHYQRNRELSDSLFTLAKNKQVAVLQIEHETEQKEQNITLQAKSIELLKNNAQLEKQKQSARLYVLLGILAITFIVLGFGYNRYRFKQRSNQLLESKQKEINSQNEMLQALLTDKDELLTEKDWLLKEVHHRVKNNLQIVMSLLSSQSAYLENTAAIEAIRESQNRVQAISLIHQKLYKSTNVASINMPAYVADLLEYLADCFDTRKRHIRFEQVIESFNLDLAQAVPIGLILNESVTNAIKYAFGDIGGQIIVALQLIKDETLLLTIADDGKGLPANFDTQNSTTLGMEMMKALSKQLGGEFKIENNSGVRISIEFQIEKVLSGLAEKASGELAG